MAGPKVSQHQTRQPSSIAPWSSTGTHVPIVATFGADQGS